MSYQDQLLCKLSLQNIILKHNSVFLKIDQKIFIYVQLYKADIIKKIAYISVDGIGGMMFLTMVAIQRIL